MIGVHKNCASFIFMSETIKMQCVLWMNYVFWSSMAQLMFINSPKTGVQVVARRNFSKVTKSQNSFCASLCIIFSSFSANKAHISVDLFTCAVGRMWIFSCSFYIWAIIQIICCGKIYYKLHNNHKNEHIFTASSGRARAHTRIGIRTCIRARCSVCLVNWIDKGCGRYEKEAKEKGTIYKLLALKLMAI